MASGNHLPEVHARYDGATHTISYVVGDPASGACAIIDSVLDFDASSGRTSSTSADELIAVMEQKGWKLEWILETHAHADHLSAAAYIRRAVGGRIGIGEGIIEVQRLFKEVFNLEKEFLPNGGQFDHLFRDGERFQIGNLEAKVLYTPGHTPACCSYVIGDAAFVGDTLFMPDYGTARCDFPGGSARQLFRSIQKILALPDDTRLFLCHDYQPGGREPRWETTVSEQKRCNIHLADGVREEDFVARRLARDATLSIPALILPSVQVNIRAGELPPPEENGTRYLKIPLDRI